MAHKKTTQEVRDILQIKEATLAALQQKSDNAIAMVKTTIGNLETVNSDIQKTREEIDTYMSRLTATRDGLSDTYEKNEQIMQNFKKLLCME